MINRPKILWVDDDNQYSELFKSVLDQCAGDSRKLFRLDNSLSKKPLETVLLKHDDPTKLANQFGTFFFKKIEIIKENLEDRRPKTLWSKTKTLWSKTKTH